MLFRASASHRGRDARRGGNPRARRTGGAYAALRGRRLQAISPPAMPKIRRCPRPRDDTERRAETTGSRRRGFDPAAEAKRTTPALEEELGLRIAARTRGAEAQ